MTTKEERRAEAERAGSNLRAMAEAINLTPEDFFDAVKRQCVTGKAEDVAKVTPADFVAFFHTAKQYGLDPLRREIMVIPTKHGPRVYVTFDGWMRVLVSHPDYKAHGWRYNFSDDKKTVLDSVTCWIARKSMAGTDYEISEHTEFMVECRVTDNDFTPWKKWPRRMLAEKAVMQCVRFTFAMYVPDLDDVTQAEAGEAARAQAEADAPPAQGPIAPAAPIAGAKRARGKKAAEPELPALPPPDVEGQTTIDDFLRGKAEPVPVAATIPADPPTHDQRAAAVKREAPWDGPKPTDKATLPAYDPAASLAVDKAIAASHDADDFDDILS